MKRDATRTESKIMKALEGEVRVSDETRRILSLQAELSLLHVKINELEEELFGASEETENELVAAVEPLEKWLEQLLLNNIMNNVSDLGTLTNCGI
ncbi:MAG: hypothetical protein IJL04_01035 [Bacteroidales bacterium]|nr:hypothetical protein [Bacteroidales bacterium]MBQ6100857.1 hypothetical protein [Bacteroidales bacterium]